MATHQQRLFPRSALTLATSALALGALAACSGGTGGGDTSEYGFAAAEQVEGSEITVWVDASREPIALAFQEAHPEYPISIETYDGNAGGSDSFRTKIALFDQSGEGWPDVVFSTQTNDASWAAYEQNGAQAFAAVLNQGLMDDAFLDGFTDGALDAITVDGNVYGVRNDLAPVVLWYDQSLLDEFGYEVPTTWEEYQELGDMLAADHPGYILGSVGDSFVGTYVYYWGAQAPIFQLDGNTFTSDFSDPHSVAMTELIDGMVANGTLVTDSIFSAEFVSGYQGKVVAMPGPAWYAGAIFQNPDNLNAEAGTIGVGAPLYWEGEDQVTGNVGGGVWYGSSHSENLEAVTAFLEFVSSSDSAVELAAGLPAYGTASDAWLAEQAASGFFVDDFEGNMSLAANSVWGGWGFPSFSPETGYATVVVPALAEGTPIADIVDEWQTEVENEATVQGYDIGE